MFLGKNFTKNSVFYESGNAVAVDSSGKATMTDTAYEGVAYTARVSIEGAFGADISKSSDVKLERILEAKREKARHQMNHHMFLAGALTVKRFWELCPDGKIGPTFAFAAGNLVSIY